MKSNVIATIEEQLESVNEIPVIPIPADIFINAIPKQVKNPEAIANK